MAPETPPPFARLVEARITRRSALRGAAASLAAVASRSWIGQALAAPAARSSLTFRGIEQVIGRDSQVAAGYTARPLLRWGDPLDDSGPFAPRTLTAADQATRFGVNNDFLAFLPLPRGSQAADRGLLFANHEFPSPPLMFPDFDPAAVTREQMEVEQAAIGAAIVEVRREADGWRVVRGSPYNRRITATTPIGLAGPAAGHPRLKTAADPTGREVLGTLGNCAGGVTPWGTVLSGEENFNEYFGGAVEDGPAADALRRYGMPHANVYGWPQHDPRFDLGQNPHEGNRFGWVVEIDPYDPSAKPIKRTALGRLKHEGATTVVNHDGRLVIYMGDDERFQFLYRYVSEGRYDPADPASGGDLLDRGTLFVARFDEQELRWLPLRHGEGPLTSANGFAGPADVLIDLRQAAAQVGGTPMDRPEGMSFSPITGRVYSILTNNTQRSSAQVDPANPRAHNRDGHLIELVPPGGYGAAADHTAETYFWNVLLLGGDPNRRGSGARYHPDSEAWLSCPDNCAVDPRGRLWISTDQGSKQAENRLPDGLYGCDVEGKARALVKMFYAVPRGAELCGPTFTPDGETLFVAVQHPGEERGSTFEAPTTRWPDFDDALPPRSAVVAITRDDGGPIGG